jgi:hypothetical protein
VSVFVKSLLLLSHALTCWLAPPSHVFAANSQFLTSVGQPAAEVKTPAHLLASWLSQFVLKVVAPGQLPSKGVLASTWSEFPNVGLQVTLGGSASPLLTLQVLHRFPAGIKPFLRHAFA